MTEFGRYLKQCPAALKDKTRTLSLLKDALKNDLPKFRVLQAAYELGILEAIQRSNPISTDDRLKITTGLVSQYAMLENAAKNAIDYWQDSVDADILYRALNDADECRESRINSAESTARPAIPIKPQQNPAENLLKIESISQDSIRMGIRLQWKKQSEIECYEIWRAKESEQPVKIKEGSFPIPRYQDYDVEANCCYTYLEKQDYILKRQNERIAEQKKELQEQSIQYVGLLEDCRNQRDEYAELFNQAIRQSEEILKNNEKIKSQENELEELFSQWVDVNDLFNDAVNGSYDQAVLTVSDVGLNKALQETVNEIDQHLEWLMEPERIADFRTRKYAEEQILCLRKNIIGAIKSLLSRGTQFFYIPEVKKAAMEQIKEDSRPSVLQKLHQRQEEINQREQTCTKPKKRSHGMEL